MTTVSVISRQRIVGWRRDAGADLVPNRNCMPEVWISEQEHLVWPVVGLPVGMAGHPGLGVVLLRQVVVSAVGLFSCSPVRAEITRAKSVDTLVLFLSCPGFPRTATSGDSSVPTLGNPRPRALNLGWTATTRRAPRAATSLTDGGTAPRTATGSTGRDSSSSRPPGPSPRPDVSSHGFQTIGRLTTRADMSSLRCFLQTVFRRARLEAGESIFETIGTPRPLEQSAQRVRCWKDFDERGGTGGGISPMQGNIRRP